MKRICLIVDNPLRDLDGICLITWHLIKSGAEVFIVPMNFQGFEIPAIRPDVILANYVRKNNADALRSYHNLGARIAIIDTEGLGIWWKDHALNMEKLQFYEFVDEYFCWGNEQADIIKAYTSFSERRVKVTGSPRYDFIESSLRQALPNTKIAPGYILINTNFPVLNPLYEFDTGKELKSWIRNGVSSSEDATKFAKFSKILFEKLLPTIGSLALRLPDQTFVIRPHPFESINPYREMAGAHDNIHVIKEGTSLQWINNATLLLQLNCLTGLEATMMGVETIGFEWLNETELKSQNGESDAVTRKASSLEEMIELIENVVSGKKLSKVAGRSEAISGYIDKNFHSLEGTAAQEIAGHLIRLSRIRQFNLEAVRLSNRRRTIDLLCTLLGARGAYFLKKLSASAQFQKEREKKIPDLQIVVDSLARIGNAKHEKAKFKARKIRSKDYTHPWRGGGFSIRVKME